MKNSTERFCRETPDPGRSRKNLERFLKTVSDPEPFDTFMPEIARLFSFSQFLAHFSTLFPDRLLHTLRTMDQSVTKSIVSSEIEELLPPFEKTSEEEFIRWVRFFKRDLLLRITLRDITGRTGTVEAMEELTCLAEGLIEVTLRWSLEVCRRRYGEPPEGARIALIGLGKLGGEELNYSSDVDLIGVYDSPPGETTGILSPSGVCMGRVSVHEFYNRVIEVFSRILSLQTDDGIGYRTDLRLRPQGQKGPLAQSIDACRRYYENWARTWERMVLIRARPVGGDRGLGDEFLEVITPFVWRSLDYPDIEDIRAMKKKIDSTFSRNDIKRGYGGIREAEFFVQTFQLIYGAERKSIRSNRIPEAIDALRGLGVIPEEELDFLWESYLYLRKIENYLQMRDDLQIHKLPEDPGGMEVLAKKMGYYKVEEFTTELRVKRMGIKNMYNSLLGTEEDIRNEALTLLEDEMRKEELLGYLTMRGIQEPAEAVRSLVGLRERTGRYRTRREKVLMREVLPLFLDEALRGPSPGRTIRFLEQFFSSFGGEEAYLEWFLDQKRFIKGLVKIFAQAGYLGRIFLSNPIYLDLLLEGTVIRKRKSALLAQLERYLASGDYREQSIVEYKQWEELRIGLLYFSGIFNLTDLMRGLSRLADSIINISEGLAGLGGQNDSFLTIGLGKLGGRELTFGSDLDILYVAGGKEANRYAETITRILSAYTDRGQLYSMDLRLRPDGSKGTILKDMEGLRTYYLRNARPWEVQALIKARPIGGSSSMRWKFMRMREEVFRKRGAEIQWEEISSMRSRIITEVSGEEKGMDIKFGPGGLEDIEFYIQWLQMKNWEGTRGLLVQNTMEALRRLKTAGIISERDAGVLKDAWFFLRTAETLLRLDGHKSLQISSETARNISREAGLKSVDELTEKIGELRGRVSEVIGSVTEG
jgi:glutamate-ammonia-ligase adenylyltransferase